MFTVLEDIPLATILSSEIQPVAMILTFTHGEYNVCQGIYHMFEHLFKKRQPEIMEPE